VINDTVFIWLAALLELIEGMRTAGIVPHLLHLW
jgi:hypothetical protein